MARITAGGTKDDYLLLPRPVATTIRLYTAKTGGTQHTGLLFNGQSVSEIPVPPDGFIPEHQWPDGVTSVWVAASTTSAGFEFATRLRWNAPSTGTGGGGVSSYLDLTDKPTVFPPSTHSHPSSQVSDSTAAGRAVLTAADASAQRVAMGVSAVPVRFSAVTASVAATGSDRAEVARTIVAARMRVAGAPVGSALVAVVQHSSDGGATWSTVTTLSIAAGSTTEAVSSTLNQAQSVGHLVRLNVTSVGSTAPATGVVVDVIVA